MEVECLAFHRGRDPAFCQVWWYLPVIPVPGRLRRVGKTIYKVIEQVFS